MKILLVEAELCHANRRTDIMKLIVAFRNFSKAPKKKECGNLLTVSLTCGLVHCWAKDTWHKTLIITASWFWNGQVNNSNITSYSLPFCHKIKCVQMPVWKKDLFILQNTQTASGADPASYLMDTWYFPALKSQGCEVNSYLLVPNLRLKGATPLLPIHTFIPWTRKTFWKNNTKHISILCRQNAVFLVLQVVVRMDLNG